MSVVEEDYFLSKADYMEISPGLSVTKEDHLLQSSVSMTSWVWVDLRLFTTQIFDKNAAKAMTLVRRPFKNEVLG